MKISPINLIPRNNFYNKSAVSNLRNNIPNDSVSFSFKGSTGVSALPMAESENVKQAINIGQNVLDSLQKNVHPNNIKYLIKYFIPT
ncbi:hypothetical protein II906_10615 [bacterium]|nr:hypothetical protein [bacterium]